MNDMQRYPPVSSVGRSRQRYSIIIIAGAPIRKAASEGHIATCSRPQLWTDRARSYRRAYTRGYHWRQHSDMLPPPEERGPPLLQGGEAGADIASTADFGTSLACMYACTHRMHYSTTISRCDNRPFLPFCSDHSSSRFPKQTRQYRRQPQEATTTSAASSSRRGAYTLVGG